MILGIDPGIATTGFSVITDEGSNRLLDCGVIRTKKEEGLAERLHILRKEILEILRIHSLRACSVERIYFSINKKTAIDVAQARGVIMEAVHDSAVPIFEYSPPQVKKAVTGNGRASKNDVRFMIRLLFRHHSGILQDDSADAIAIALCHKHRLKT